MFPQHFKCHLAPGPGPQSWIHNSEVQKSLKTERFYNSVGYKNNHVKCYKAPFIPLSVNIHTFYWYKTVEILCLIHMVLPQTPLGCYIIFGVCTPYCLLKSETFWILKFIWPPGLQKCDCGHRHVSVNMCWINICVAPSFPHRASLQVKFSAFGSFLCRRNCPRLPANRPGSSAQV